MKKIGIITFHAAHNYGSMLQTFALQSVIKSFGYECEVINLRTKEQKEQYSVLPPCKSIRHIIRNCFRLFFYSSLNKKHDLFEKFLKDHINLSFKEYSDSKSLEENPPSYDYYISGSDQIWNINAFDFESAYFLPFVKNGIRIAYAASFGPVLDNNNQQGKVNIKEALLKYNYIGVREEKSIEFIKNLIGNDAKITVDPTLLLTNSKYDFSFPQTLEPIENPYIFFYSLYSNKEMIKIVKYLSKQTNLKVIVSNFANEWDLFNSFEKHYASGPIEFLSLIKNAKLVCTSSYHATVFSILYNVPFFSIQALNDNRRYTLLKKMGLENRSIDIFNMKEKVKTAFDISFDESNINLMEEKNASIEFLKNAINGK